MYLFLTIISEASMRSTLTGRVLFQNHLPAKGVEVRVFDRDDPGKVDDDLTIRPGISDDSGSFKVTYDPFLFRDMLLVPGEEGRFIPDLSDKYIPYARFSYEFNGQQRVCTSPILRFRREYLLPEAMPLQLDPRKHAFSFPNSFQGYPLPFRMPAFPGIREVESIHGLCGGVSAAIYDYYLCGRSVPSTRGIPEKGTPLYKYLYKRQMQTYGSLGETIMKFCEWMLLPDQGINSIRHRTYRALEHIKEELDNHNAVLLGLVYVDWRNGFQIWLNHQVLAYRYTSDERGKTLLYISDPNYPQNHNVIIESDRVEIGRALVQGMRFEMQYGVTSSQWVNGHKVKDVRGFFPIPYAPVIPPHNL
jgi:hypothetical protein